MAVLPSQFRKSNDVPIITYTFVESAAGIGYIQLYAGKAKTSYHLTGTKYSADSISTSGSNSTTDFVKAVDIDFDMVMNKALDLEGAGLITLSYSVEEEGSTYTAQGYVVARLRRVHNGVEEEIASAQSATQTSPTAPTPVYSKTTLDLTVPKTRYVAGDTLRVTLEGWSKSANAGSSSYIKIAHEPNGSVTGWDADYPTNTNVLLPARIEG